MTTLNFSLLSNSKITILKDAGFVSNKYWANKSKINIAEYQGRVLTVIERATFGWHQPTAYISQSKFINETEIPDFRHISRAIKRLEEKVVIFCYTEDNKTRYGIVPELYTSENVFISLPED